MKGTDIFCASQAETGMHHLNIDEGMSSTVDLFSGGRAIDRHNPIITDASRSLPSSLSSCSSSQPTISSSPKLHHHKSQKSSSKPINEKPEKIFLLKEKNNERRKSSADQSDVINILKSWSCMKPPPSSSSRYLLGDMSFLDGLPDFDPPMKSDPLEADVSQSSDQVVVLKVSLHCKCKGCERKMRKHISQMKGVTSFNIDFATRKVTIIGNVKPLDVLASVSKVRNAQLWSPPTSSSSFPPDGSDHSQKN